MADLTEPGHRAERTGTDVRERVEADIRKLVGDVLKLAADEIHPADRLADLGCDSVGNTQLALRLSEHYGIDVAPSLFYTYFTLEMLRDHLIEEQHDAVAGKHASADETAASAAQTRTGEEEEPATGFRPASAPGADADDGLDHRIAVIGMSGRFPQARTVEEFWQLLAEGRDAVAPLPAHRRGSWAGTAGASEVRGGWLPGEAEFDPLFFEISPGRPSTWTRGSGCCCRRPGGPWRTPGTGRSSSATTPWACSSAPNRATTRAWLGTSRR